MAKIDPCLIIIEDDPYIQRFLRTSLNAQGFNLFAATTGKQGLVAVEIRKPDLVILDLGLPDMDGMAVIKAIRRWSAVPIIILSARDREQQKIEALDNGADDYLTKPFGFGELMARIRVALRNSQRLADQLQTEIMLNNRVKLDLQRRIVTIAGEAVHLTPIQYRLLSVLVKHADKVMTHQQILKQVWGPSYQENAHYLRIYMSQLRQKLEADPTRPEFLLTETGVGYRLKIG